MELGLDYVVDDFEQKLRDGFVGPGPGPANEWACQIQFIAL